MKKLLLLTLVLMATNLFGQTLLTEYRFNTTVSNTSNLEPFSYVPNFTNDRAGNAYLAYQLTNNPSSSSYAGPSGSSARTVSLWYSTNSNAGSPVIFSYGNSIIYQRFGIYLGATGNPIFWGFNYDYDFGGTYAVNTWHHLVLMFNGTNVTLYMNGTLVGTVSRPLLNTAAASQFSLLTTGFASKTVVYDDLKVFSGVLTASQVNELNTANILQPITSTTHNFCSSTNPTVANLTTSMGTNIQWYANQFGGAPLLSTTPLSSGTYWCSQSVAGLESFRSSTLVTVSVDNPTLPIFSQIAPICSGATLVLPSTSTNGISGSWSPAVNNTATTTYTFSSNPCSPTTTMTVTVNSVPTAPAASASVSYAQGLSATALTATGTNLLWYTQAVGGIGNSTAPVPSTAIAGVVNYWVSQTNASGCESPRTQIKVTVGNTNCLQFDGTNDLVQLSSGSQKPTGNSSYTIEMWIAPTDGAFRGVINWGSTSFNNLTALSVSGIIVQVQWGGGSILDAYYNFVTNQWNHIATTWDGINRRIYINGVLVAGDQPGAHNCTPNTQLVIGSNGGFTPFAGAMDEVRIFDYSKTALQIQANMYCEIPNNSPGLSNYFRFNQGVAGGTNTGLTIATNQVNTSVDGGLAGFGLTGSTSNWINGSPMETQAVPNFGFATPLNICSGTSYVLPTTSLNGITGTWSPVFNNTTSASYTFTPNAGQCATTAGQTVQILGAPMASTFTQVPAICEGGILTAIPVQSMQGNNGTWSPALNNMATTTYTFTPNPGVCANTATMTITVNPGTPPTFTQVAPVCTGASFTLPTTSNNGFTGTWTPAINTSATTTYTFTPASGQCASSTTMTVTVNSSGTTPTFTQVPAVCAGTTIAALPTTSNNGIVGTWSPAINNLTTTTYTFLPSSGVCPATATMTITINPAPAAPGVTSPISYAQGASTVPLTATGTNLLWYTTAIGGTGNPTAPTPSSVVSGTFQFWVSQTNGSGCESPRSQITVSIGGTNCLHFDGVNDYIPFSNGMTAPVGNSAYTIEAMVNLSVVNATYQRVAGWGTGSTNQYNGIVINNTGIVNFWWGNDLNAPYTFATNTWYHVAATFDGTTRKIFVNGVQIGSDTPVGKNTVGIMAASIGGNANGTGEFLNGRIDEVRIWSIARTSSQLSASMSCELPSTTSNLMSYFRFNTGTGGANNAGMTQLTNTIPTGNNGTLTNFVLNGNTSNWLSNSPVQGLALPTFVIPGPYCAGATIPPLSTTSTNGITGTWSPAINNTTTTGYYFTPDAGQCASPITTSITINPSVTPTFTQVAPVCTGTTITALPTTSTNGVAGTWSPTINNLATTTYTFTPSGPGCFTSTTMTITVNPAITPTFTQVAPICAGASLGLNGVSLEGILGSWAPAINNTATTTYTYTANSGQCVSSTNPTMTIVVNPLTTPTFTQVAAICQGETLSALPTTSTNTITGSWSPALNNQATTTYTFVPSSGQCANTQTMVITVNTPTLPSFTQIAPVCIGNTIAALPTTSLNGISGSWSPGINSTATTTYTFSPASGQCASSNTMTIVVTTTPVTPTFAQQNSICEGELFTLPLASNEGVNGTWSPVINNMATTTYTFMPNPNECAVSTTMTVTVNPIPSAPTGNAIQTFSTAGTTLSNLVVSPSSVIWYSSMTNAIAGTNPLPMTTSLVNGNSYFAVNTSLGCSSVPFEVSVTITVGLQDLTEGKAIILYPNPAVDEITLANLTQGNKLSIKDASGRELMHQSVEKNQEKINLKDWTNGIYFVQIVAENGASYTTRFVIKK